MENKLKINEEEQKLIQQRREQQEKVNSCYIEIENVLKKYNANLSINPNSYISNPSIMVVLN